MIVMMMIIINSTRAIALYYAVSQDLGAVHCVHPSASYATIIR